jgi:carbon monoxide dehydrogenase subunit G
VISIRTSTVVAAPIDVVWADLADVGSHVEWMSDVSEISFTSPENSGVGAIYEVRSRFGPVRLRDRLEISDWRPGETLAVRRRGVVGGEGRFTLEAISSDQTRLIRDMDLDFPWWLGAGIGERIAAPLLRRLFAANLEAFTARYDGAV